MQFFKIGEIFVSKLQTLPLIFASLQRLGARLKQNQIQKGPEVFALAFDKDDDDILNFVTASANLRSLAFGIETRSKFDIKRMASALLSHCYAEPKSEMAGNIIPAIATTNAMTAALCVLQAFQVIRRELGRAKMVLNLHNPCRSSSNSTKVFLERSAARVVNTDTLKPPNSSCTVCSMIQSKVVVDTARATLSNLVKDVLQGQLGYGDEFSISNDIGVLYDPELDDNLPKKFDDLGIHVDSFLTVIDEEDENPRINLSLSISEQYYPQKKLGNELV